MKTALLFAVVALSATAVSAQPEHSVRGYVRSDGTYVAPHYQTNPDATRLNNYSTQGNYNPHTGQNGTVNPYSVPTIPNPYSTKPYEPE